MKKLSALVTSTALFTYSAGAVYAQEDVAIPTPSLVRITKLGTLISSLISIVLIFAALAAFAYLLWGGFQWITSGGDKHNVETARNRIQAALLGLLIVFAAYAIFIVVEQFLGISIIRGFTLPSAIGG